MIFMKKKKTSVFSLDNHYKLNKLFISFFQTKGTRLDHCHTTKTSLKNNHLGKNNNNNLKNIQTTFSSNIN